MDVALNLGIVFFVSSEVIDLSIVGVDVSSIEAQILFYTIILVQGIPSAISYWFYL